MAVLILVFSMPRSEPAAGSIRRSYEVHQIKQWVYTYLMPFYVFGKVEFVCILVLIASMLGESEDSLQ